MSEIVFNAPSAEGNLSSQVENLQTTLASLNQQVIILQEALQERDQKIAELQKQLVDANLVVVGSQASPGEAAVRRDDTLTIVGLLINLYKRSLKTLFER